MKTTANKTRQFNTMDQVLKALAMDKLQACEVNKIIGYVSIGKTKPFTYKDRNFTLKREYDNTFLVGY